MSWLNDLAAIGVVLVFVASNVASFGLGVALVCHALRDVLRKFPIVDSSSPGRRE